MNSVVRILLVEALSNFRTLSVDLPYVCLVLV